MAMIVLKLVWQVPGTAKSETHLGDQEVEIGMGIHNENGILKYQLAIAWSRCPFIVTTSTNVVAPARGRENIRFTYSSKLQVRTKPVASERPQLAPSPAT